jgi:hypothetical protein
MRAPHSHSDHNHTLSFFIGIGLLALAFFIAISTCLVSGMRFLHDSYGLLTLDSAIRIGLSHALDGGQSVRHPALTLFFEMITRLANTETIIVVLVVVCALFFIAKKRAQAYWIFSHTAIAAFVKIRLQFHSNNDRKF